MSMVMIGRRLSDDELRSVLDDPTTIDSLLYGDDEDEPEEEVDEAPADGSGLYLDKAWHGLHYLITGTAWDVGEGAGAAILGGREIGGDVGNGPARLLDAGQVREVSSALDALDVDALRARFDPAALSDAEIYPFGWTDVTEDFDGYLAPNLAHLREFYRAAATAGQAVLLALA